MEKKLQQLQDNSLWHKLGEDAFLQDLLQEYYGRIREWGKTCGMPKELHSMDQQFAMMIHEQLAYLHFLLGGPTEWHRQNCDGVLLSWILQMDQEQKSQTKKILEEILQARGVDSEDQMTLVDLLSCHSYGLHLLAS